jgi:hypothetical protein
LRGEGKGLERSHQTLDSSGTRAGVGLNKGIRSKGVPAATSPSGRWAMLRAAAVAAPVSADGAYAALLEGEGDRPISMVAATRKPKAAMAEGGGLVRL